MIKAEFVMQVTLPSLEVVNIYRLEGGSLIGIDESFLANTDEPIYSPYDVGIEIDTSNL